MAGDRNTEETPLLHEHRSSPPRVIESKKTTLQTYTLILGFLAILTLLVHSVRTSLPTPLSDTAAARVDGFPGVHAYDAYMSYLTEPHPVNSRANIAMKEWLDRIALDFKAEGEQNGVQIDVITNDTTIISTPSFWYSENEYWIIGSRNLIVRVNGKSGSDDAILINAHYDSVPTSYGVTDDGMGTVVELELLRYFVKNPPQKTIIFLFNNFEEGGLIGSKQFVKHPWFKTVKLFINLEGAGAGGRALLFRCSSLQAAKILASNSPQVHATPLGNDMFRLGLLKSDTDYTIFESSGAPGMDIAFYAPRSHYHTPLDNLNNTSPGALQHMGQMVLATLQAIDKSDGFFDEEQETQLVYYDILGKIMFAYDFATHGVGNCIALVMTPILALLWAFYTVTENDKFNHLVNRSGIVLLGFISTLVAFIFTVLFVGVTAFGLLKMNPLATYGNIMAVTFCMLLAGLLGVTLSQLLLSQLRSLRRPLSSVGPSLYGLAAFWWMMLIFSSYAGSKKVAVLYFAMFSFIGNILACVLYHSVSPESRVRMPVVFLTQVGLPFTVMVDQGFLVMDSMRHSTVDGTPEIAVYGLVAIPVVLMAIQLQPWINAAGQKGPSTLVMLTALVLTFAVCCVLQPFNSGWSPNKIIFGQEYNSTSGLSTVSITAAAGIPAALHQVLPANESDTIHCEPFMKYRTRCTYETNMVPIYADAPNEMSIKVNEKQCAEDLCRMDVSFTAQNSILCRIRFDGDTEHITKAWAHGLDVVKEDRISSMITYSLQYGDPVEWGVEYHKNANLTAAVGCFYDEWTQGQLPAFTYLHENLDDTMTLLLRGQGLSLVYYDRLEL